MTVEELLSAFDSETLLSCHAIYVELIEENYFPMDLDGVIGQAADMDEDTDLCMAVALGETLDSDMDMMIDEDRALLALSRIGRLVR